MPKFQIQSDFAPMGDQPIAIEKLVEGLEIRGVEKGGIENIDLSAFDVQPAHLHDSNSHVRLRRFSLEPGKQARMGHFCAAIDKSPETRAVLKSSPSQLE